MVLRYLLTWFFPNSLWLKNGYSFSTGSKNQLWVKKILDPNYRMIFVFKKCTPTRIIFEMYKQISSKNSESPCKETQLINSIFAGLIDLVHSTYIKLYQMCVLSMSIVLLILHMYDYSFSWMEKLLHKTRAWILMQCRPKGHLLNIGTPLFFI